MTEASGYHLRRAVMTALLIWGLSVLLIEGCESMILSRAIDKCWEDTNPPNVTDRSDVIDCLETLGLDEHQILESFTRNGFDLNNS